MCGLSTVLIQPQLQLVDSVQGMNMFKGGYHTLYTNETDFSICLLFVLSS